mgnify:CR=1 FL=1
MCCVVLCISHALTPVRPRLIHREHAHSTERHAHRKATSQGPPGLRTPSTQPPAAVCCASATTTTTTSRRDGSKECSSTSQARAGILAVISQRPTFPRSPSLLRRRPVPDLWQVPGRPSCSLIPNWPSGAARVLGAAIGGRRRAHPPTWFPWRGVPLAYPRQSGTATATKPVQLIPYLSRVT